jgi:hypothetical protein
MTIKLGAAALVLSAVLVAGCAPEAPYEYSDYRYHQVGQVIMCYNEDTATLEQVKAMAEDICQHFDRTAFLSTIQKHQCSWTAPTQATFGCGARPGETPAPFVRHLAPMRRDQQLLGQ